MKSGTLTQNAKLPSILVFPAISVPIPAPSLPPFVRENSPVTMKLDSNSVTRNSTTRLDLANTIWSVTKRLSQDTLQRPRPQWNSCSPPRHYSERNYHQIWRLCSFPPGLLHPTTIPWCKKNYFLTSISECRPFTSVVGNLLLSSIASASIKNSNIVCFQLLSILSFQETQYTPTEKASNSLQIQRQCWKNRQTDFTTNKPIAFCS